MKCDIFHVLHPLTFVKAARSGVIGEHFQPQPAFTGRFCSRLDGAKYLLAVASARCVRQQIELMQQRTGRTFRTYRLTTGVFRKADRVGASAINQQHWESVRLRCSEAREYSCCR